jgi:DNA-binding transcriptional regulator YiaG
MVKYKSKILQMLHEDAVKNFDIGAITEEEMREYDRDCLVQEAPPMPPLYRHQCRPPLPLVSVSGLLPRR